MKKIIRCAVIAISLLSNSFAFSNNYQCPPVNNIKALGLNHIKDASTDFAKHVSYEPYSTYGTDTKWNFFMICSCPWSGECKDEEILKDAQKTLKGIRFDKIREGWGCEYSSSSGPCRGIQAQFVRD